MRQSVRRWMFGAGTLAVVGAAACGQAGVADAAQVTAAGQEGRTAAASAYTPPSKPLHVGQNGAAVRSVQRRLAQLHYYPGPIDGKYGNDTLEAAWAFREVQGLRLDSRSAAQPITRAFELALVHPKKPWVLAKQGAPNRIEINQNIQVLVLYKGNKPQVILHVSTGGRYTYPCPGDPSATCGPAITPDGKFKAHSLTKGWHKSPLCPAAFGCMYNSVWIDPAAGVAIHGDLSVPWYPASHACIRIWMDAARWFYRDLTIGGKHATPVYVRGTAPAYPASN
jgi:Putative peptidoglycan binding domain/L,D-transpeptidase catalytic domain